MTNERIEEMVESFDAYNILKLEDGTEEYVWNPEVMRVWLRTALATIDREAREEVVEEMTQAIKDISHENSWAIRDNGTQYQPSDLLSTLKSKSLEK